MTVSAALQTKRRCAGCNRVIVGRPNKLYALRLASGQTRRGAKGRTICPGILGRFLR